MRHTSYIPTTALVLVLLMFLMLTSCSLNEIRRVELPPNMVPFKDAEKKLEFQLPAGWEQSPVESVIEKSTDGIRLAKPVAFRKGDRGMLSVWCFKYDFKRPTNLHMFDVVNAYAPMNKYASHFEVEASGTENFPGAVVYGFNASHVVKGDKKDFFIVTVIKEPSITKMHKECTYMALGKSTSNEYSDEIKTDIYAIAVTMKNSGN